MIIVHSIPQTIISSYLYARTSATYWRYKYKYGKKKKAMSIAKLPLCVAFRPEEFYLLINLGLQIFTMYRYGSHLPKAIDYLEVK